MKLILTQVKKMKHCYVEDKVPILRIGTLLMIVMIMMLGKFLA